MIPPMNIYNFYPIQTFYDLFDTKQKYPQSH